MTAWLTSLGLTEYEEVLMDAGYDDIDFISDISNEELQDIGITKKGQSSTVVLRSILYESICVCVCVLTGAFQDSYMCTPFC